MDKKKAEYQGLSKSERIRYKILKGFICALAHLPLRALYGLSDFAAFVLGDAVRYRRQLVTDNLRRAFPEASESDIRKWRKEFYRNLCDIFVETAKLAHIGDSEVARRVELAGMEHINSTVEGGRSVVLLLGHCSNWEWVTAMAREISPKAISSEIYHPLSDKAFDLLMLDLRSRFGTENITMTNAVRRLLQIHREGGLFVCGFIADQRPFGSELKHWTDFMGIDTPYVNGGEVIGRKLGTEFLYVDMERKKRGYYKLSIRKLEPIEDGEENPYTRAYLRELEKSIRKNPPAWLWSHNRWLRSRSK